MIRNSKISDENTVSRGKKRNNITTRKKSVKPKETVPNSPRGPLKAIDKNVASPCVAGEVKRVGTPASSKKADVLHKSATKRAIHPEAAPRSTNELQVLPDAPACDSAGEKLLPVDALADENEGFAEWLDQLDLSVSEKENVRQQLQGMLSP